MKNLLLVLLFVLPTALFSASPSCLAGMEISLVDANGKVVKSGKFDNRGELTLDGLEDVAYTIRLTNKGKSCDLDKPKSGSFSGLPTGKRTHKPIVFNLSSQKGSDNVLPAAKKGDRDAASGLATGRRQHSKIAGDEGIDQDCDGIEISVSLTGGGGGAGKATFKEFTVSK